MHIEQKNKNGISTPFFITLLVPHPEKRVMYVRVKPFASIQAHDDGEDALNDGTEFRLQDYPSTGDVEAWAYETIVASMGDATIAP